MKCPKCQYLGVDGQSRCRHCGYDLSLAATADVPTAGEPVGDMTEPAERRRAEPSAREQARAAIQKRAGSRTPTPDFDLPLFATPGVDDRPALTPLARPPLAVRRTTGDGPRARAAATALAPSPTPAVAPFDPEPRLDLSLDPPTVRAPEPDLALTMPPDAVAAAELVLPDPSLAAGPAIVYAPPVARVFTPPALTGNGSDDVADAAETGSIVGRRAVAGLVDLGLLLVIDAAVYAGTLRVTGLSMSEGARLPLAPMLVFFALLAMGYLSMCILLAGQTLGKHLFHLKVVESGGRPVRFGHAVVRAGLQVLTVPLLGLGFLPALLGTDRRTLYDRLAGTEVVSLRNLPG